MPAGWLEAVSQLPADAATAELELALQISLGNSLMSTGRLRRRGCREILRARARVVPVGG